MEVRSWIDGDETAKDMLCRALKERPFILLPPLHRVPLRAGNVVELVGPSSSAKTQILTQAAISCILPREWNGVLYGGLGQLVTFLDLDCRFDVLRLAEMLKHRIAECKVIKNSSIAFDEELFLLCMKRFLYVRCYDSFEFLSTLKTLHCRLQREKEASGIGANFLLIDSIGAFHWIDRVSSSLPLGDNSRKPLSLQNVLQTVVQEIRKLLLVHPMLVMATKAVLFADRSMNEAKWNSSSMSNSSRNVASNVEPFQLREYMPSAWQALVTHRILLRPTDDQSANGDLQGSSMYISEWLLPQLGSKDKFIVKDTGVYNIL